MRIQLQGTYHNCLLKSVIRLKASACTLLLLSVCFIAPVQAEDVPNFDKQISIAAREQPIQAFFSELFGELSLPVNVDASVVGSVNGDFRGTARAIYRDVEKAFQLVMYYDRSTIYIYSANQVSRNIIPMSEKVGKRVMYNAQKMRIGDAANQLEWSDMGLVVSGTDRYQRQIESYTKAIRKRTKAPVVQQPASNEIIKVFKLKYAWADDTSIVSGGQELMVRGVASLLRTVVESGMVGADASGVLRRSHLPRTEQGLRGKGLQSVGRESLATRDEQVGSNTGNRVTGDSYSMRNTRIVADPLNNAVIIRDRADRMPSYQDLINSLDIEPQMVEIEATIIDMDTDRLRTLGIDWRYQNDGTSILFGSAAATNDQLNVNPAAIADGLNGFTQNVLNNKAKFLSHIKALETQGAARIVSKPHVMTLANVEALLDTTSTFFIRVAGREEVDLFNVSVGTTMRVTPHVFERGDSSQIKMKIDIVDGSQSQQTVDDIPVIEESTINTQAIISAGQSLLIGGLVREFKTSGVSKVPVLGDIPGLGALFRSHRKSSSRMERMFLITPRLNTQASVGKRYSVPILSGTEQQILESGASRLEPALAGLASRDARFPVKQRLPRGQADAELSSQGQAVPRQGRFEQIVPQPQGPEQPLLRDQFNEPETDLPTLAPPEYELPISSPEVLIVESSTKPEPEGEWQRVGNVVPKSFAQIQAREEAQAGTQAPAQPRVQTQARSWDSARSNTGFESPLLAPPSSVPSQQSGDSTNDWIALPGAGKQALGKSISTNSNRATKPIPVIKTRSIDQDGWTEIGQ